MCIRDRTCCDHWGIDDVTISSQNCANYWYDWAHVSGTVGPVGDPAVQNVNVNADTTFSVCYTDGGGFNCCQSITINVLKTNVPNFSVADACLGSISSFNDLSTISAGNITGWSWDFGDGIGSSILQNPTYVYANPGSYNVTLSVTSDSSCIRDTTITTVVFANPLANFSSDTVCLNDLTNFIAVSYTHLRAHETVLDLVCR